jgi:hypothetical protein
MAQPILVTQSTSIVQVDTSLVTYGSPAVVLLSTLNAPGVLVTIRDIAGLASTNRGVIVSTTKDVHFLDGPSCNIYAINQPYGFLTVTPKTSSIWAVTNTFAFPEGSTAANVNQFTANFATISSLTANQALMSTVGISTLSTDTTQVRYNLSVGQSTITNSAYVKGSLTALSSISTAGSVYAASSVVTRDIFARGHIQASCIQVQQSTGYALQVGGAAQFASTISTHRNLDVGGNISTLGNLAVGGNFAINGGLNLTGLAITGGVSTSGTLGVAKDTQLLSSLLVKDDGYFYRSVSVASNLLVAGSISTLNSLAASSITTRGQAFVGTNLSVLSSIYAGGNVSVAGDLAVAGNLIFNDVLLDLNALSVFSTLTVGAMISTMGNIAAGQGLRVMGSTILQGLVSTGSSLNVGGSISTTGNLAVGGAVTFFSSLSVRGAVTKLGDVNVGGLLSTQSTLVVGDSIRVTSNLFIGGVISSLSSINAAGSLLVGGQTNLSSSLSTLGTAAFFSSVQIQGSVSVMSSMVVRADMTVQGTLNAAGFSLPGAAAVASLGVQTSTGVSAVFAGSTVQTGLFSTLGGINMGGQFSTPNTITTGSTLYARDIVTTAVVSSLSNMGVGGDLNVLGTVLTSNLTVNCNTILRCNVTFYGNSANPGSVLFYGTPYFNDGFNADQTQTYNMGTVVAAGGLQVGSAALFSNIVTANSNITTSSLTVTANTLMSNFTSTLGQAAFFSSVQIQGNLSVFSSVSVNCNLVVGGTLTAQNVQLPGGAILQTLAVTSNVGFTVNISSSTLHAGLFSTSGAIYAGREISTMSSLAVGGAVTVLEGLTVGRGVNFGSSLSTVGQAAFFSSVQIQGSVSVMSSIVIRGNTRLEGSLTLTGVASWNFPLISANKLQASSFGLNVAQSSNAFDMAGTAAIQGTGRSNTLRLTATTQDPGITLSNSTGNYTIFNTKSGDIPGAGALAVLDNSETYRMVMLPGGNTAIGKSSAAAPLDVNGLALADRMGAPLAQFSTLGALTVYASSMNVESNIAITRHTGSGVALEITSIGNSDAKGIVVKAINNATLSLSNNLEGTGMTAANVRFGGSYALNSSAGDSIIRTESASNKLLFTTGFTNATLALSNGSVGIGTVAPTATLDVNGTINARTLYQGPAGVISSLGSASFTTSTATVQATATVPQLLVSSISTGTINASNISTNALQANLATVSTVSTIGNVNVGSNLTVGTSTLVANVAANTVQMNAPLTLANRQRLIVLAGNGTNSIAYSTDGGVTYTSIVGPVGYGLTLATNGSILVAGGLTSNTLAYSFDGINWVGLGTSIFSSQCRKIIWDGRQFLAAGTGTNTFARSPNGITWTGSNPTAGTFAYDIAYNGSIYMLGYNNGSVFTSSDLVTWTQTGSTNLSGIYSIAWTGTRWLVAGIGNSIVYSSVNNGSSWVAVSGFSGVFVDITRNIAVYGNTVVLGGNGTNNLAYSLDSGVTFTFINVVTGGVFYSVSWTGDRFMLVGNNSSSQGTVYQSFNGISWTQVGTNGSILSSIVYAAIGFNYSTRIQETIFGGLAADSISTTGILTVADTLRVGQSTLIANPLLQNVGINCNAPRFTLDVNGNINAGGNLYVAGTVFQGGGGAIGATVSTSRLLTSTATMSSLTTTLTATLSNSETQKWFIAGGTTNAAPFWMRSSNGMTWTTITGAPTTLYPFTFVFNGFQWLVGGQTTGSAGGLFTSSNGSNWTAVVPSGYANVFVQNVNWNGSYYLICGTDNTSGSSNNRCLTKSTDLTSFTSATNQVFSGGMARCTAWNGALWVAVGKDTFNSSNPNQCIKYSFDGLLWNSTVGGFGATSGCQGVCVVWNGRMFVAGGTETDAVASAVMKYSYDGITWYDCVGPVGRVAAARSVLNIAWNGKRFVAVGLGAGFTNFVLWSDDGINWSYANATFSLEGDSVIWNGSLWVASGADSIGANTIKYSSDGINWTTNGSGTSGNNGYYTWGLGWSSNVIADAQIGNTYFYNGQNNNFLTNPSTTNTVQQFSNALLLNELYTDTTGKVGINCNAPQTALGVNGFVTMNKQKDPVLIVIGVDGTGTTARVSVNGGSNWFTPSGTSPRNFGGAACWDGRRFLFSSYGPNASLPDIYASSNGTTWTNLNITGPIPTYRIWSIIWTGQFYLLGGWHATNTNANICYSLDGVTWIASTSGAFSSYTYNFATNGRMIVAVGTDSTSKIKYSSNGLVWLNATNGFTGTGWSVTTNGRIWVAVGGDSTRAGTIKWSVDGINWNNSASGGFQVYEGHPVNQFIYVGYSVAWNGQYFLAVGNDTQFGVQYSFDGMNWLGVSWPTSTYENTKQVIWTGTEWRITGKVTFGGVYTVAATGSAPPVMGTPTTFSGTSTLNPAGIACSSNVYADLQVENLAIYGRNQFPFTQSTNNINLSSSNMTINNGIVISSNGRMGYGTTNPGAAFDVLGGGGANGLFVTTIAGSLTGISGSTDGYTTNARLSRPIGVAADSNQNAFFADFQNNKIRVVFSNGVVSTLAGSGTNTSVDGTGANATFAGPHGICIDPANANLYVCDYATHVIRKVVIATGVVTTIAGTSGSSGFVNGTGATARFQSPIGCVVRTDNSELYIADTGNNAIRKITLANSNVVTFAGSNTTGRVDAVGNAARFTTPSALAITATTLYIADTANNMLRSAVLSTSNVSTIAGSPTGGGTTGGASNITVGTATAASLWAPQGLALNPANTQLYIMNTGTANGTMSVYNISNSNVSIYMNGGLASSINVIDGALETAKFNGARMLATDPVGNIYVSEDIFNSTGNRIRKITSNYTSSIAALSFDYSGGGLSHYVRSRHMPTDGRAAENAIDFFINTSFNTLSSISTGSGNVLAASITAAGVGIGTATPCNMLHIAQDLPYSYRALNPLPAQVVIGSASATMRLGTYYTGGQAAAGTIQVADTYWGNDRNPSPLLLNPLGGPVGIGCNTPAYALDVSGAIQASFPGGAAGALLRLQPGITGNIIRYGGSADVLQFIGVGNVERMRITGANVGIGTTNPQATLQVTNASATEDNLFWVDGVTGQLRMTAGTSYGCIKYTNSSGTTLGKQLYFSNTGIGIGTTTPRSALEVNGKIYISDNGTAAAPSLAWPDPADTDSGFYHPGDANIGVTINGTEKVRFNGNGVGILCNAPDYPLTINGNLGIPNAIGWYAKNSTGSYELFMHPRWSDNIMYIDVGSAGLNVRANGGGSSRMFINSSGNLGIGTTTPGKTLDIVGSFRMSNNNLWMFTQSGVNGASTRDYFTIGSAGAIDNARYGMLQLVQQADPGDGAAYLSFIRQGSAVVNMGFLSNTNTFLINAGPNMSFSGTNVGIGTTTPGATLHVAGGVILCNTTASGFGGLKLYGTGNETAIHMQDPPNASPSGYTGWFVGQSAGWGAAITSFGIGRLNNNNVQAGIGLWMTSNGNVGIGATTPAFQTSIYYAGNNTIGTTPNYNFGLEVRNTTASGSANRYNGILFTDGNSTQGSIGGYRVNYGLNYIGGLVFLVGSQPVGYTQAAPANTAQASGSLTEAMRITPSGYVGIGTTGPLTTLDVNGKTVVGSYGQTNDGIWFRTDGTPTANWQITTPGAFRLSFLRYTGAANPAPFGTAFSEASYIDSVGNYVKVSDGTLKDDIQPLNISKSYTRILGLRPKTYIMKTAPKEHIEKGQREVGFIAQEVQETNPYCVQDASIGDEHKYAVSYNDILIHAVGAIQEQAKLIESLQSTIQSLQAVI